MKALTPVTLIVILAGVGVAVAVAGSTDLVVFKSFSAGEFAQLLAPLFLVSLFVERALEVFISGWRGPTTEKMETRVRIVSEDLKAAAEDQKPGASPLGDAAVQPVDIDVRPLRDAEKELRDYKCETKRWAWIGGLVLGVAAGALGFRALGMFVDPGEFEDLREWQRSWFHTLDVMLTAMVLAGGSDGMHQIMNVFTNFLKTSAEKAK